ncbi:MAG: succinyl-CoA synthetase subunit beta [Sulfitobacter sp.]
MKALRALIVICLTAIPAAGSAMAQGRWEAVARAFAENCFNPRLTAKTAQATLAPSGARIDFYDLRPAFGGSSSKPTGRAATPGTDRRCEVASDGYHFEIAKRWAENGLRREKLAKRETRVPLNFAVQSGTTSVSAYRLNASQLAILQIGLRQGPNGNETFINVERLAPRERPNR